MDTTTLIIIALVVVALIIAGLAWGTYKARFRVKKATVKTPVFEAEMERKPADDITPVPASSLPPFNSTRRPLAAG
jgi:hypothetical protein